VAGDLPNSGIACYLQGMERTQSPTDLDGHHRARRNRSLLNAYERSIDQIVLDLSRLAQDIERKKTPRTSYTINDVTHQTNRPYLSAAEDVVQSIMNVLPNLNLSLLIERAHDVETLTEKES
jgi:hypothetical protein